MRYLAWLEMKINLDLNVNTCVRRIRDSNCLVVTGVASCVWCCLLNSRQKCCSTLAAAAERQGVGTYLRAYAMYLRSNTCGSKSTFSPCSFSFSLRNSKYTLLIVKAFQRVYDYVKWKNMKIPLATGHMIYSTVFCTN